VLDSRE